MYLVNTRSNISFDVNNLSQFIVESRQVHWVETHHVLGYLRGIVGFGLRYVGGDGERLHGYSYSYWEGSEVDRKRTYGSCFNLGSTVVSWFSKKQTSVELSSVEEEYMEASLESFEAIRLHKLLVGLCG
jgi:hypothetical protein